MLFLRGRNSAALVVGVVGCHSKPSFFWAMCGSTETQNQTISLTFRFSLGTSVSGMKKLNIQSGLLMALILPPLRKQVLISDTSPIALAGNSDSVLRRSLDLRACKACLCHARKMLGQTCSRLSTICENGVVPPFSNAETSLISV